MKESIKSYHLFLTQIWKKLLLYVVYPLVVIGYAGSLAKMTEAPLVGTWSACCLMVMAELYFDVLVFGGIASKETNKLEYLKTSVKGMMVLKKSVVTDGIRRFLSTGGILLVTHMLSADHIAVLDYGICLLFILFVMEVGLVVIRGVASIPIMAVTAVVGSMLTGALLVPIRNTMMNGYGFCLFAILYVLAVVWGRVFVMKKVRGSYYDE